MANFSDFSDPLAYAHLLVKWNLFKKVIVHFLIADHTKFSPDRMFGWASVVLLKKDIFSAENVVNFLNNANSSSYHAILVNNDLMYEW